MKPKYKCVLSPMEQEERVLNAKQLASLHERFDIHEWHGDRLAFLLNGNEVIGYAKYELLGKNSIVIDGIEAHKPARENFRKKFSEWSIGRELLAQVAMRHQANGIAFNVLHDHGLALVDCMNKEGLLNDGIIQMATVKRKLKPRVPVPIKARAKSRTKKILRPMQRIVNQWRIQHRRKAQRRK